jgi:hypothetical protein
MPKKSGQVVLRGTVSLTDLPSVFRVSHFMNRAIVRVRYGTQSGMRTTR